MVSRARRTLLASLDRRSARRREGLYLLEGARLIDEAIRAGAPVETLYLTDQFAAGEAGATLLEAAAARSVPAERISKRDLDRISGTTTPPGVAAVVRHVEPDPDRLRPPGLLLALDGVSDPGNVGTLIRAADAFGAVAVIAGPGTADFENGKVLRAAMGSTFHVVLLPVVDLPATLAAEREAGLVVVAAVLDGEDVRRLEPLGARVAVVLGNEARGVSPEVLAVADRRVTIPCPGRAESLNVAMAGAILFSHLTASPRSHERA